MAWSGAAGKLAIPLYILFCMAERASWERPLQMPSIPNFQTTPKYVPGWRPGPPNMFQVRKVRRPPTQEETARRGNIPIKWNKKAKQKETRGNKKSQSHQFKGKTHTQNPTRTRGYKPKEAMSYPQPKQNDTSIGIGKSPSYKTTPSFFLGKEAGLQSFMHFIAKRQQHRLDENCSKGSCLETRDIGTLKPLLKNAWLTFEVRLDPLIQVSQPYLTICRWIGNHPKL